MSKEYLPPQNQDKRSFLERAGHANKALGIIMIAIGTLLPAAFVATAVGLGGLNVIQGKLMEDYGKSRREKKQMRRNK